MSTTLKLDGSAVAFLMEQDPEFKLELQRAVLAQFTRQIYEKEVSTNVRKIVAECFKEHEDDLVRVVKEDEEIRKQFTEQLSALVTSIRNGGYSYATTRALSSDTKTLVSAHVSELLRVEIFKQEERIPKITKEAFDSLEEKYVERIEKRLELLDRDFALEMRRQITADVMKRIATELSE